MDIHDPTQAENIQKVLKDGTTSDFWDILCQSIKDTIEHLEGELGSDDFKDLPADQYKFESELLRAKIKYLRKMMREPDDIIASLANPNTEPEENFDPYAKPDPEE